MAPQKLTEYEKRRLENIKRNDEMLAALNIHSKVSQLSAAIKSQRTQNKSYKVSPEKKQTTEKPIILRRSLRTRGVPPDSPTAAGLKDDVDETSKSISMKSASVGLESDFKKRAYEKGPISMENAYRMEGSDAMLIETILSCSRKSKLSVSDDGEGDSNILVVGNEDSQSWNGGREVRSSVDIEALKLEPEYVARVVPGRIFTIRFFPSRDTKVVVVGNKDGDVGFWNINAKDDKDGNGIYLYHPHSAPVSGIVFDSFSLSKMFSCSYDGFVRLMDIERGIFDLVYSSDYGVFSLSQKPDDMKSLYFSGPDGKMSVWDVRAGKSVFSWNLHEDRINTIDFNLQNTNIMATSSTDTTVCIWDLRNIGAERQTSLTTVSHKRAVHSAYFSPSGNFLATTSVDDKIGLLSGENYEDVSMIYHNNRTSRWISPFRGIWGWDDSYIFIGNLKRGVDVISTTGRNVVATLQSERMTAIPCRFDSHPYEVGMLAGATGGGQVYTWKQS